ncbi:hypothetical protein [Nannocystis pusilla]|uniref:Alkyl hydroperoxide reductase subunit C/ Thiol specific antioxidant domain-containing protein n=1 Tax=Nannocystis pusilla TaxID=889268 RepID=A0ABS7TUS5_9BACT|nr:hypothetical protein [Nannocystis pusilla]MBZ5711989.1 hypothetical protein [Nannocystis pusilla]
MPRRARVFALAAHLVAEITACAGRGDGPVPPSRAEAPPPFAVAPEFAVPDSLGNTRGLADLTGPNGLILVTYRGHW